MMLPDVFLKANIFVLFALDEDNYHIALDEDNYHPSWTWLRPVVCTSVLPDSIPVTNEFTKFNPPLGGCEVGFSH